MKQKEKKYTTTVIFQIPGVASYSFVIRQISTNSGVACAAVRCEIFSALAHT